MKRLFSLLVGLLLISSVLAVDITVEKITIWDKVKDLFDKKQPLYISGGDFVEDSIQYNTLVNAEIELKTKIGNSGKNKEGYAQSVVLRFYNGKDYADIGEFYFKTETKPGDWISLTVKELDTWYMPKDWCGQFIYLQGKHYVWVNGDWYEESKEQKLGKFETTNGGAKLYCPSEKPKCEKKDLGKVCVSGDAILKKQSGLVNADGSCNVVNDILMTCKAKGMDCSGGVCEQKEEPIAEGTMKCYGNYGKYQIYKGGSWKLENCASEICENDKCSEEEKVEGCTEDIKISCSDGSSIVSISCVNGVEKKTTNSCPETEETYYFPNEELTDCVEVNFETDYNDKESCVKEYISGGGSSSSSSGGGEDDDTGGEDEDTGGEDEDTGGEVSLNWKDLFNLDKYGYYSYGLIVLILLGIIVYALIPERKRRR